MLLDVLASFSPGKLVINCFDFYITWSKQSVNLYNKRHDYLIWYHIPNFFFSVCQQISCCSFGSHASLLIEMVAYMTYCSNGFRIGDDILSISYSDCMLTDKVLKRRTIQSKSCPSLHPELVPEKTKFKERGTRVYNIVADRGRGEAAQRMNMQTTKLSHLKGHESAT